MSPYVLPGVIAALVALIVLTELATAVIPLVIVLVWVPAADRHALAHLIAACDNSRKLRVWPALRVAVAHRRLQRAAADRLLNPAAAALFPAACPACGHPPINPPYHSPRVEVAARTTPS